MPMSKDDTLQFLESLNDHARDPEIRKAVRALVTSTGSRRDDDEDEDDDDDDRRRRRKRKGKKGKRKEPRNEAPLAMIGQASEDLRVIRKQVKKNGKLKKKDIAIGAAVMVGAATLGTVAGGAIRDRMAK